MLMKKTLIISLVIFIAVILCIRAAAPIFLKGFAERKLTELFNMETRIRQVDVNPLRARISLIGVRTSHIFGGEEATSIKIEELDIEPGLSLSIYGLEATIQRDKDGRVDIFEVLKGTKNSKGLIFKKIMIKDARLKYVERYNLPTDRNRFKESSYFEYYFTGINILYHDRNFSMRGLVADGANGNFEMSGKAIFSKDGLAVSGTAKLNDFWIPYAELWYCERFPAYINYGKLNMASQFYIENGTIDAKNSVSVADLILAPKLPRDSIFELPADEVINYLKDEKGRLSFDFALKGPLGSPKLSLSDEFGAALQAAVINSMNNRIKKIKEVIDVLRGKASQGDTQQAPSKVDKLKSIFELLKGKE